MPLRSFLPELASALAVRGTHGDLGRRALDQFFSVTYAQLRRLPSSVKPGDRGSTLSPMALVNEAWLKLLPSPGMKADSPRSSRGAPRVLCLNLSLEVTERRNAHKRGDDREVAFLTVDPSLKGSAICDEDLIALRHRLKRTRVSSNRAKRRLRKTFREWVRDQRNFQLAGRIAGCEFCANG